MKLRKDLIVLIAILPAFALYSAAQEQGGKSRSDEFREKMVAAPEWEFCSMYGRALQGELHLSNVDSWSDDATRIIKEVAKERKIKVNDQRISRKKVVIGDSKCHFFAHLGYTASEPIRTNTTAVGKIKREQVVLSHGLYVYFDNDKFTAYQSQE